MSSVENALKGLQNFFEKTIKTHGADPKGVDWKDEASQHLRFDQLLKLHTDKTQSFSILDFGCGYGALVNYLKKQGYQFTYTGYDMTPAVVETATATFINEANCTFTTDLSSIAPQDYVIGSGLFNMKFADTPEDEWHQHMLSTIDTMWKLCTKGLAFNSLTSYSDPEYMRADLYYAEPTQIFDYCKRNLSKQVALLHDYGIYDFTILVRR
jgi:SAM-dependent methyltransferase